MIVGPPNSGRAGEVRRRIEAARDLDPVLVVPTGDDATRFERDLCEGAGAVLGTSIRTFASLTADVARAGAVAPAAALTPPQRLALTRAAVRATDLDQLRRSARRPGFAPALATLIGELQAALVGPDELRIAAQALDDGGYEAELAALYASYERLRDASGRADAGSLARSAIAGLRADPGAWGERPVFVYGFDDLTRAQLELLGALAAGTDVVVAVTYEDRDALRPRATMMAELREELGAAVGTELARDAGYTAHPSLAHLDAHLFEPGAPAAPVDGAVVLLESAGELGEAEAIGAEVARLLDAGEAPDSIAIVLRDPERSGRALGRTLTRLAIPVSVEATTPLGATSVGRSLLALCRAIADDDPSALLDHLRTDPALPAPIADRLELRIRRERPATIADAVAGWGAAPRHLTALGAADDAPARLWALARIAPALAEGPFEGRAPLAVTAGGDAPFDPVEQRAAVAAAELLVELAELDRLPGCESPGLAEAAAALEVAPVDLWRGPTDGRVRIVSPYRARTVRARHLFCAGLQEGEFPRRAGGDPLLGDRRRAALAIGALRRREAVDEERYLFHACVSRPTERLYLSWRSADDEGAPAARSPFVDEVCDLLDAGSEAALDALTRRRGLERVVFDPWEAPTERELERAAALAGPRESESLPGPLAVPEVVAELEQRVTVSASTLERWLECPYRWFTDHELAPQRLDPESDALRLGGVVHAALEALYRDPPGDDGIPRPGDLDRWRAALASRLDAAARERGMRPEDPADAVWIARARAQIEAFLADEAGRETELRPRRELLEAGFGIDPDGPAALALGEASLRGRIDRIDVAPDGSSALVRDYKSGAKVRGRKTWGTHGKLQLQLYVLAARESLSLTPVGGLYTALASHDRRPRGMTIKGEPLLDGIDLVGGDACDAEQFEDDLQDARERAGAAAREMREGRIVRRPLGGACPAHCDYQPICRLERALGVVEGEREER